MTSALRSIWVGLRTLLVLTVVVGLIYPLAVWAIGQVFTRDKANGSLLRQGDTLIGSSLIGQEFGGAQWFHSRPSAAGDGYDAMASSASNLSPSSAQLLLEVEHRRSVAAREDGVDPQSVPPDALTASGSGLDPAISPAYAQEQAQRVARERGLSLQQVLTLIDQHTHGRDLGFLGEPTVNVLELNLALAQLTS